MAPGQTGGHTPVQLRCPFCHVMGTLEGFVGDLQLNPSGKLVGSRRCPNPDCHGHVFVVLDQQGRLVRAYPAELLDFDATNLPAGVAKALREAVQCHAEWSLCPGNRAHRGSAGSRAPFPLNRKGASEPGIHAFQERPMCGRPLAKVSVGAGRTLVSSARP